MFDNINAFFQASEYSLQYSDDVFNEVDYPMISLLRYM